MNRNSRKDEMGEEQNVQGLRKITYQSEDGGIIISNDVFGLTIRQFERKYKACLDRRKLHEQYILNIRYPDKTSNEYMEYLEKNIYYKKDWLPWTENELKDRYLFEHIVNKAGTEIDIRKRQQLFLITDKIHKTTETKFTKISSGSLAEGLDLPGSDKDVMFVIKCIDVIGDIRNIIHPVQRTTLLMETDTDHPGFSRLRLIEMGNGNNDFLTYKNFTNYRHGSYLSVEAFFVIIIKMMSHKQLSPHGPCLSDQGQNIDLAFCFRSKCLPYNIMPWASRYRQQWPPKSTIDKIKKYGCLLVPIGPRTIPYCNALWRLSFSVAEKLLVYSFNFTQLLCYCLLKLTLTHIVNTNKHAKDLLCSYFLKTALFWVSEEIDIETFRLSKLFFCFSECIDKLIVWVKKCYCPNYFIPEQNMFIGNLNSDNNTILLNVLDDIKGDGIDRLTNYVVSNSNHSCRLLRKNSEMSFIELDFLFYRISYINGISDISTCLKALMFIESLIKSKHFTFIIDSCKYYYAAISQFAAQLQPKPAKPTVHEMYSIHKRYHRFLQDGIKTDAVSGWLLFASFYYITGQYKVTLKLTDYVLKRCSSDLVLTRCVNYSVEDMKKYRKHVNSTMTLHDKMRIATLRNINYARQSSLIQMELQLEVEKFDIAIPPTVMSHCLRFLCYHHLGELSNRQQALRDFYLTVKDLKYILSSTLSNSITILGVCFEISGDKDTAYQFYDEALRCVDLKCQSARVRKSKLLEL